MKLLAYITLILEYSNLPQMNDTITESSHDNKNSIKEHDINVNDNMKKYVIKICSVEKLSNDDLSMEIHDVNQHSENVDKYCAIFTVLLVLYFILMIIIYN